MATLLGHAPVLEECEVILASNSPRRYDLLRLMGFRYIRVVGSTAEKTHKLYFDPSQPHMYALQMALLKGRDVARKVGKFGCLIAADTIVVYNGKLFNKPRDKAEARRMLRILSGQPNGQSPPRTHQVITGVAVAMLCCTEPQIKFYVKTDVTMGKLTDEDIRNYVERGESCDKAGGYGIQSVASQMIEQIHGCFYNVQGLPIYQLSKEISDYLNDHQQAIYQLRSLKRFVLNK